MSGDELVLPARRRGRCRHTGGQCHRRQDGCCHDQGRLANVPASCSGGPLGQKSSPHAHVVCRRRPSGQHSRDARPARLRSTPPGSSASRSPTWWADGTGTSRVAGCRRCSSRARARRGEVIDFVGPRCLPSAPILFRCTQPLIRPARWPAQDRASIPFIRPVHHRLDVGANSRSSRCLISVIAGLPAEGEVAAAKVALNAGPTTSDGRPPSIFRTVPMMRPPV